MKERKLTLCGNIEAKREIKAIMWKESNKKMQMKKRGIYEFRKRNEGMKQPRKKRKTKNEKENEGKIRMEIGEKVN